MLGNGGEDGCFASLSEHLQIKNVAFRILKAFVEVADPARQKNGMTRLGFNEAPAKEKRMRPLTVTIKQA